jgi:hypothetical protein
VSESSSNPAVADIVSDLSRTHRRRIATFWVLLGLFGVLLLGVSPEGTWGERTPGWRVGVTALVLSAVIGLSVGLGVPLWQKTTAWALTAVSVASLLLGLLADTKGPIAQPVVKLGLPCFLFGSVLSAGVGAGLGAISGTRWRRFPSPALALGVALSAVSMAVLHIECPYRDPLHRLASHLPPLLTSYLLVHWLLRLRDRVSSDA